jgi:hypothetical protein
VLEYEPMTLFYIAIDDTDNLAETAEGGGKNMGTGARARVLAGRLTKLIEARHLGITRHQLFVHPEIPFTSHNSAACIVLKSNLVPEEVVKAIVDDSIDYLLEASAEGSDAGLCVTQESQITPDVVEWGRRAKGEVLLLADAHQLADDAGIHLSGHTGERTGVIGALAAVGLRHSGDDGRYLELPGLRELMGRHSAATFMETGIERFRSGDRVLELSPDEPIEIGEKWPQPVLIEGRPTLLLKAGTSTAWSVADREEIKLY